MGHRLRNHNGLCKFLHGHNYLIHVTVEGDTDPETGMVIDFSVLKRRVKEVLGKYDHAFVLETGDDCLREVSSDDVRVLYIPHPPTAECLAFYWKEEITAALGYQFNLHVQVNETRDCGAFV